MMKDFEEKAYKVFDMFKNRFALVTAGGPDHFNTCTIAWGSLGSIWGGPYQARPVVTVYVNPERYTWEFLRQSDHFTVSFFPDSCKKALAYLGSRSGRDSDKIAEAGLHPVSLGSCMTFEEADCTFVCHKLYEGAFEREGLTDEINDGIYADWDPHWMFVGEILEMKEKQ